ncbi:MAG: dTDP-4-dehydrorhamnose 3,5-epimerase [Calditrichae bacterium]|nr:dTDP-4-dehydrorhamnose 3,5-epimerase [Calditrichota bacterium]MCB9059205.1 dTDP-4-dehydrorhamnose 3,5-epimerase [Calditrichia bacterium]
MPFEFKKLEIPSLIVVKPKVFNDNRGHFFESYKKSEFVNNGIIDVFIQDNCSKSAKNVLRGLHYQLPPYAQSKLVRCIQGHIFDVAVDIRKDSPTFGKWLGYELSETNMEMLYIPEGFAHGFVTLSETAEIEYKVSAEYTPAAERGIIWNDPTINIEWPVKDVLLSDKDKIFKTLSESDIF